MKKMYRIVRSLKTLEYRVEYSYIGIWWSIYSYATFNSLTQAEDRVAKQRQEDAPDRWETVRTYG